MTIDLKKPYQQSCHNVHGVVQELISEKYFVGIYCCCFLLYLESVTGTNKKAVTQRAAITPSLLNSSAGDTLSTVYVINCQALERESPIRSAARTKQYLPAKA